MKNLLIIIAFFIAGTLRAQEFYVEINTSNDYPGVGENFKVEYAFKIKGNSFSYNGRIQINRDKSNAFEVVQERASDMEMDFGFDFSSGITLKKLTQILKPTKEGNYNLATVEFVLGDTKVKSKPYEIHVGKAKPKTEAPANTDNFARIKLNKSTVYVGEPILATYYMYSKFRPQDAAVNMKSANKNFWTEEISSKLEVSTEAINNQSYYALECKKVVLFPQESGKLEVAAFEGQVQVLKQRRGGFPRFETFNLTSNSPTINVLPLPNNSNSNFVGDYKASLSTSTTSSKVNEGFDLKITIEGTGNLKRINELELNLPPDFEVFDPEITENLTLTSRGYKGKKTFNYLVIPRAAGTFSIESFNLDYFNQNTKDYETSSTPSFDFLVEKGDLTQNNLQTYKSNKQEVELLDNDIRYIKTETNWISSNDVFYMKWWFWLSLVLPILAFIYLFLIEPILKQKSTKKDYTKEALNIINELEENNSSISESEFLSKLSNAWQLFLCDKLKLNISEFNQKSIKEKLANSKEVLNMLNQIEMASYSPVSTSAKTELLAKSKTLINQLKNEI